jgi:DNA-directed RNA polymerase specialized sigma24 family protein
LLPAQVITIPDGSGSQLAVPSSTIPYDPVKAEVVKLRFFAGLTMPEVAQALGLSLATVERCWTYARLWLCAELTDEDHPE